METEVLELTVSTPAFQPDGNIHSKYTCDGEGVSPPLSILPVKQDIILRARHQEHTVTIFMYSHSITKSICCRVRRKTNSSKR
jgi:hypothetical protein